MRPHRLAACALLLALVPAVPSAVAAPKATRCKHLVEDERGDASAAGMDILYADVTIGRTEFVAVLRLAAAPGMDAPLDQLGGLWRFAAAAGGVRYEFELKHGTMGSPQGSSATVNGAAVPHTLTISGGSIAWKIRRSILRLRPAMLWTDAMASAASVVTFDAATTCGPKRT